MDRIQACSGTVRYFLRFGNFEKLGSREVRSSVSMLKFGLYVRPDFGQGSRFVLWGMFDVRFFGDEPKFGRFDPSCPKFGIFRLVSALALAKQNSVGSHRRHGSWPSHSINSS